MKKSLYYILQWTWGLPLNIIGALAFIVCGAINLWSSCIYNKTVFRIYRYRKAICIVAPKSFGGIDLGMFFVRGKYDENVCAHEYGHSIQNIQWGWLFIFVIGLPSLLRAAWRMFYRRFIYNKTRKKLSDYYSIWFEKQASLYGEKAQNSSWL